MERVVPVPRTGFSRLYKLTYIRYKSFDNKSMYVATAHRKTYFTMYRLRVIVRAYVLALVVIGASSVALPVTTIDNPSYAFNYAVSDPVTKDNKAQWEVRDGDAVKGSYSLVEPDGSLRVVDYAADQLTGFNAVVKKVGVGIHPTSIAAFSPIATVAPVAAVAPIAPVTQLAPINVPALPDVPLAPIVADYGLAPLPIGLPKIANLGHWSLPWDPLTGSYGGWVPLNSPLKRAPRYVTIFSKKLVNGMWHKSVTGPIPLFKGTTLVFKKKN